MKKEEMINISLINLSDNAHKPMPMCHRNNVTFWGFNVIYLSVALVATVGNGLVLYAAYKNRNHGPLKVLDNVIKSLAISDMLFGLVGMPCRIIGMCYEGRYSSKNLNCITCRPNF